jgi:hypothetical protein
LIVHIQSPAKLHAERAAQVRAAPVDDRTRLEREYAMPVCPGAALVNRPQWGGDAIAQPPGAFCSIVMWITPKIDPVDR